MVKEKEIQKYWEERSKKYGKSIKGVIFKSLDEPLNDYIHQWMLKQISIDLKEVAPQTMLDLGCGYGRVSKEILKMLPGSTVSGLDISKTYVNLFNKHLSPRGKAVVGDIRHLPYKDHSFDMVMIITTLLYMTKVQDQNLVIKEILRVLKKGGRFIIIEPNPIGHSVITLGGLLGGRNSVSSTDFKKEYLVRLVKKNGGKIDRLSGMPVFTFSLLFLIFLSKVNRFLNRVPLKAVSFMDNLFKNCLTFSLYISYSGTKR